MRRSIDDVLACPKCDLELPVGQPVQLLVLDRSGPGHMVERSPAPVPQRFRRFTDYESAGLSHTPLASGPLLGPQPLHPRRIAPEDRRVAKGRLTDAGQTGRGPAQEDEDQLFVWDQVVFDAHRGRPKIRSAAAFRRIETVPPMIV